MNVSFHPIRGTNVLRILQHDGWRITHRVHGTFVGSHPDVFTAESARARLERLGLLTGVCVIRLEK